MSRRAWSWVVGGAGFFFAVLLFSLTALWRGGETATPSPGVFQPGVPAAGHPLPRAEELGIVLPDEPPPARISRPEKAEPERAIGKQDRPEILAY